MAIATACLVAVSSALLHPLNPQQASPEATSAMSRQLAAMEATSAVSRRQAVIAAMAGLSAEQQRGVKRWQLLQMLSN